MRLAPVEIIGQMTKLHQYAIMSAPSTAQYAAIEAMKNGDGDIASMREQYDLRRRLIVDGFNRMGLTCFEPEGAFYVFPCIRSTGLDSEAFCEKLIYSERVAVVPGPAFGACGEGLCTRLLLLLHQAHYRGAQTHRAFFEGASRMSLENRVCINSCEGI